jgi:hypothetical protein
MNDSKIVREIEIRLKRAPDDPAERDPIFQEELRTFSSALRSAGTSYSKRAMTFDSAAAIGYPLAEFIIRDLGPAIIGVVGTAVGAWISTRNGRKVRLKIGDLEVEARTVDEVDQLLQRACSLRAEQETKPREIPPDN